MFKTISNINNGLNIKFYICNNQLHKLMLNTGKLYEKKNYVIKLFHK